MESIDNEKSVMHNRKLEGKINGIGEFDLKACSNGRELGRFRCLLWQRWK
jgi:hypothetical protein